MRFFRQKFQTLKAIFISSPAKDKVIFVVGIVAATGLLVEHLLFHTGVVKTSAGRAQDCRNAFTVQVQVIEIKNDDFIPNEVTAKVCDQLRFVNRDSVIHEPALGQHPSHLSYPGFEERGLAEGDSNQFVLSLPGKFSIHDHLNEEVQGVLLVK